MVVAFSVTLYSSVYHCSKANFLILILILIHLSAKKQSELCHFFFPFSALLAMMRDQVTTFSSALQQRLTEVRVVALLLLLPLPNTSI